MEKVKSIFRGLFCCVIFLLSTNYGLSGQNFQKKGTGIQPDLGSEIAKSVTTSEPKTYQDPTFPLLRFPADFRARRQNSEMKLEAGQSTDIFRVEGPGCVRHIFFVIGGPTPFDINPVIRIYADGDTIPLVDMDLHHFFGVLLGQKPYRLDCAVFQHLPMTTGPVQGPGYNCYFPIPFSRSCRITIEAAGVKVYGAAMVDWQQYSPGAELTPYRLHAVLKKDLPARHRGSILMADISGSGFVAAIFKGIRQRDFSDMIYHTKGQLWLIDGETDPYAIQGHNEEDDFSFFWGYQPVMTAWIGVPYHRHAGREDQDGIIYRIFGPDPMPFRSSLVLRCGSRADDTESVVYYYRKAGSTAPEVITPESWQLTGPVPCSDHSLFMQGESIERQRGPWPESITYEGRVLPVFSARPEHAWIDLWPFYRQGTAPEALVGHSVYARTRIVSDHPRQVEFRIGFDDWLTVWLNGENLGSFRHDDGFCTETIGMKLRQGDNELLIKNNNSDYPLGQRRLWVLNCIIRDPDEPTPGTGKIN